MKSPFTEKEKQFIIDNRQNMCSRDLAVKLKCSKTKVQKFLKINNLQPSTEIVMQFRRLAATGKTILTPAQDKIIKRDYLEVPIKKLAKKFGVSQVVIRNRLKHLGLIIPKELAEQRKKANQIQPGNIPANKGKKMPAHVYELVKAGMFKKGHLPHNAVGFKDGDLSFRRDTKTGILYVYIRLALGKWYPLHQYAWECTHGKIPKGHCLWFKDGESLNCTVENLELTTRGNNMKRNSCSIRLPDSYIAHTLARVKGGIGLVDYQLKETIMKNQPLIELKRKSLLLKRTINERQKTK